MAEGSYYKPRASVRGAWLVHFSRRCGRRRGRVLSDWHGYRRARPGGSHFGDPNRGDDPCIAAPLRYRARMRAYGVFGLVVAAACGSPTGGVVPGDESAAAGDVNAAGDPGMGGDVAMGDASGADAAA